MYDTKQIECYRCGKWVGEVDLEAVIISPKCGACADPYPQKEDLLATLPVTKNKSQELPMMAQAGAKN